jgi:hypothetical protein
VLIVVGAAVGDVRADVPGLGKDPAHNVVNGTFIAAGAVLAAGTVRTAGADAAAAAAVAGRAAGKAAVAVLLAVIAFGTEVIVPGVGHNTDLVAASHCLAGKHTAIDTVSAVGAEIRCAGEVRFAVFTEVVRIIKVRILHAETAIAAGGFGGIQAAFLTEAAVFAYLAVDTGEAAAIIAVMRRGIIEFFVSYADAAFAAFLLGGLEAAVETETAVVAELFYAGEGNTAAFAEVLGINKIRAVYAQAAFAALGFGGVQAAFRAEVAVIAEVYLHAIYALAAAFADVGAINAMGFGIRGTPLFNMDSAIRAMVSVIGAARYTVVFVGGFALRHIRVAFIAIHAMFPVLDCAFDA